MWKLRDILPSKDSRYFTWSGTCQSIFLPKKGGKEVFLPKWQINCCIWPLLQWVSLDLGNTSYGCTYFDPLIKRSKAAGFKSSPEQEKTLTQVQPAMPDILPLGPYDPPDTMVLEVSAADRDFVWRFWQLEISKLQHRPLDFGAKPCHL